MPAFFDPMEVTEDTPVSPLAESPVAAESTSLSTQGKECSALHDFGIHNPESVLGDARIQPSATECPAKSQALPPGSPVLPLRCTTPAKEDLEETRPCPSKPEDPVFRSESDLPEALPNLTAQMKYRQLLSPKPSLFTRINSPLPSQGKSLGKEITQVSTTGGSPFGLLHPIASVSCAFWGCQMESIIMIILIINRAQKNVEM